MPILEDTSNVFAKHAYRISRSIP